MSRFMSYYIYMLKIVKWHIFMCWGLFTTHHYKNKLQFFIFQQPFVYMFKSFLSAFVLHIVYRERRLVSDR